MHGDENIPLMIEAWKLLAGRMPGNRIQRSEGVASMFGDVPMPFLNFSAPDHPTPDPADLGKALEIAADRARSCPHPSLLGLCEPWVSSDWEELAAPLGFVPAMNLTYMATNALLPPRRPAPALEFRLVTDVATARDIAMVNAHAYGMPEELFECICNLYLWKEDSVGMVGYADGVALAASAAFPVGGTIYIAFVATLPGHQGKGLAEGVMRQTIATAADLMGQSKITLHATEMGRPLYSAMGFETGSTTLLLATGH